MIYQIFANYEIYEKEKIKNNGWFNKDSEKILYRDSEIRLEGCSSRVSDCKKSGAALPRVHLNRDSLRPIEPLGE